MAKTLVEQLTRSIADAQAISRRHSSGSGANPKAWAAAMRLARVLEDIAIAKQDELHRSRHG